MKKTALTLIALTLSFPAHALASPARALNCGQSGKISERITDCNHTNESGWKLVIETDASAKLATEVWLAPNTNLIFTDRIASLVNYSEAKGHCKDNPLLQNSGQKIEWRIPSAEELNEAENKSIRSTLKNLDSFFWTSTPLHFFVRSWGLVYSGYNGFFEVEHRSYRSPAVLCIATIQL